MEESKSVVLELSLTIIRYQARSLTMRPLPPTCDCSAIATATYDTSGLGSICESDDMASAIAMVAYKLAKRPQNVSFPGHSETQDDVEATFLSKRAASNR